MILLKNKNIPFISTRVDVAFLVHSKFKVLIGALAEGERERQVTLVIGDIVLFAGQHKLKKAI